MIYKQGFILGRRAEIQMQHVLALVLCLLAGVCGETACATGMYHDESSSGSGCQWCKPGTYQTEPGSKHCVPCRKGMVSNEIGANTPKTCHNCPRGTYATGSSLCAECPLNTVSPAGAYGVLECTSSPGYYSKPGGMGMECPANFYCVQGTTEPTPCPEGTISATVATQCFPGIGSVMLIDWVFGSIWILGFLSVVLGLGLYKHIVIHGCHIITSSSGKGCQDSAVIQIKVIR